MNTVKKALSVFLCAVMLMTTLCFFPLVDMGAVEAQAAITTEGKRVAFYTPEVIYLYPNVTSWTESTSTPFQYYVGNTVDVDDIYTAPVPSTETADTGKIYFAAEEGMKDVELSYTFMDSDGNYYSAVTTEKAEFNAYNMGSYYLFEITGGMSPVLTAEEAGCYIVWILKYVTDSGEAKAVYALSYVYKPYVVPYGGIARVRNTHGYSIIRNQQITWVTGVHSIDNSASAYNALYPYYQTVAASSSEAYAFSPFLSKANKAYVGSTEVSGAASTRNGGYNAVFSGTDTATSYFWAGQENASLEASTDAALWFKSAKLTNTYDYGSFDYANYSGANTDAAYAQVTPTRLGSVFIDTSRYTNLNQIPNLAVGMMITDTFCQDVNNTNVDSATARWFIGDATDKEYLASGIYTTEWSSKYETVNSTFAQGSSLATPLSYGIYYAGAWNSEIDSSVSEKTYMIRSHLESMDDDFDMQVAAASVRLNATQIDKSSLRNEVNRAVSSLGVLGVKGNGMSLYYDSTSAEWTAFVNAFLASFRVLVNLQSTAEEVEAAETTLKSALDALLAGKQLKVLFDVNYDGINPNLWVAPVSNSANEIVYIWDSENEIVTFDGSSQSEFVYGSSPFSPYNTGSYFFSTEYVSGTASFNGSLIMQCTDAAYSNVIKKFDITDNNAVAIVTFDADSFEAVDGIKLNTWWNGANADKYNTFDDFTIRIKVEEGTAKTAYSPAARIMTGSGYGELPVPTREGYSFAGWYTDETLTTQVSEGSDITSRILYAKWTPNMYSITYDNMFNMNEWANYGNTINTAGAAENGKAEYDAASSSVTITSAATAGECYTIWDSSAYSVKVEPNTTYRFSYKVSNFNGVGQHQAFMFIYANGETVDFADGVGKHDVHKYTTGDGVFFIDFTTGDNAEEFRFRIGTNTTEAYVSSATFSDIRLVEKTDYNLGLTISAAEKAVAFNEAGYGELAVATREGYVFDGWYTGTGEKITASTPVKSENIAVYSNWVANQYTVSFNSNTGEGSMDAVNHAYDEEFTLPANTFTKTGYTFAGWSLTPEGAAQYTDKQDVKNLTADVNGSVTLYAVWTPNVFTVKFDGNGNNSGSMTNAQVIYDSEASLPECGFVKTGYTFIGWSLTKDGNAVTEAEYDNLKTENGETATLYALWSENSYTLSFDSNGGSGSQIASKVYKYTETVTLSSTVYTKTGYILSGWSLEKGGEKVYEGDDTVTKINPDKDGKVTLYAVWTPVTYTIRFNAQDGTGSMNPITATYDKAVTLTANTFTKTGYHFIGWATTPGGNVAYKDAVEVKNLKTVQGAEITLYAVWEINTYTVSLTYYNINGVKVTTDISVVHGATVVLPDDFTATPRYNDSYHRVFSAWSAAITNITKTQNIEAQYSGTEAHSIVTTITQPTCIKTGEELIKCEKCTYSKSTAIDKVDHNWNEGVVTVEPGCLTTGTRVYTCSVCNGKMEESIAAVNHSFTRVSAVESTCSANGNIEHDYCVNCKKCYNVGASVTEAYANAIDASLPKSAHTAGAEANCTEAQRCTVCGDVIIDAVGHNYEITYTSQGADCTTEGQYTKIEKCTVCKATAETILYGTLHDYSELVVAPTCTEDGYILYLCSVCGAEEKGETTESKLGHTEGEWTVTTAPTCTQAGVKTNKCSVCGVGYKTEGVNATGHDKSGAWTVTTEPKCEESGVETLYCVTCGESVETRSVSPKGHGESAWKVVVEAGCDTAGKESEICNDCGNELRSRVIAPVGHSKSGEATCETDSVCTNCGTILESALGHSWDSGVVTKEPTETETGEKTYTCKNDASHKKYEELPVRVVIQLPEIPADSTVDFDAQDNGYVGNINNFVTVESGIDYTVTSSDTSVLSIDANGNMVAYGDGDVVITITTADGKYEKSFTATVRTLKTVVFDVNGEMYTVNAYVGDKLTAPEVESYTDSNGYYHSFKAWVLGDAELTDLTCLGNMYLVAAFTSSCDYREFDRLAVIFEELLSGNYNNSSLISNNKTAVANANAIIEEFNADRETRDISEQPLVDAAEKQLASAIAKIYPADTASVEIIGDTECYAGSLIGVNAYLMPVDVELVDAVWTSSDSSIGFFTDGKFFAVKSGTVTLTAVYGELSAEITVTVKGGAGARVIMFDSLLTNANYIVEGSYVIKTTTNIFWSPEAPIHFRVITDGTFEEYIVYINDTEATPAVDGTYTIPAYTGDAHVRVEGLVPDVSDDSGSGEKISFWEMITNFFKKIADFFRSIFGM